MSSGRQLPLDLPHRPALGRDDFLVADCNRLAVSWIDRWPEWPAPALVLHGPEGSGKTHLAAAWQTRSGARWCRASALTPSGVGTLLAETDSAAYVADNADAADVDQRALLHLYNGLVEAGGTLLLTCRVPPARWIEPLPDLRSRLAAAPTAPLGMPDDALIAAVMVKQFADRQLRVGDELLAFLISRVERSFAGVRRVVAALDRAALAGHRPLTIPLAREVLAALDAETRNEDGEN